MSDELTWPWKRLQDAGRGALTRAAHVAEGVRRGWAGVRTWCRTTGAASAWAAWRGVWGAWREGVLPFLRRHALVLAAGAVLVLFVLALWKVPQWQVTDPTLSAKDRIELENKARATLAQIVGGMVVLVGLYLTWQRIEVAREGQVTERFTRAIEQLGSDSLQIRLGGIYALERIARDSARDHWPIMEVLTAYVRERSPRKAIPPEQDIGTTVPDERDPEADAQQQPDRPRPQPEADIQAVLTVLGRRARWYGDGEDKRLDLHETDLRGTDLTSAHPEGANLTGANLERATLTNARLEGALLFEAYLGEAFIANAHLERALLTEAHLERTLLAGAHLEDTDLSGAYLPGARLGGAHLVRADLRDVHLEGAYLRGTHLQGADLQAAHLEKANLRGANLDQTNLYGAHLEGADLTRAARLARWQIEEAHTDDSTRLPHYLWPEGPET